MNISELVDILGQWLRFQDVNSPLDNMAAYCPFHKGGQEQTPSLYIYVGAPSDKAQTGDAYCHTCNQGWSLTRLLYALGAGRSLVDAVKTQVASGAGRRRKFRANDINFNLPQLPEFVLGAFDWCPTALLNAGFTPDILREHEIGFDRSARRIIFPIRDHLGNLVGVSGRTVADEEPRYKIYRSEWYALRPGYSLDKRKVLWGLDKFYVRRTRERGTVAPVLLCEGFKAAMWVKQCGYSDVVAVIGASVSEEQRALLARITGEVILFFDNDQAGVKATYKAIGALKHCLDVSVANYGTVDTLSPDDLRPESVDEAINTAMPYWRFTHARSFLP